MLRSALFVVVLISATSITKGNLSKINEEWIKEKLKLILTSGFDEKESQFSEKNSDYIYRQQEWRKKISSFPVMTVVRCKLLGTLFILSVMVLALCIPRCIFLLA